MSTTGFSLTASFEMPFSVESSVTGSGDAGPSKKTSLYSILICRGFDRLFPFFFFCTALFSSLSLIIAFQTCPAFLCHSGFGSLLGPK